MFPVYIFLTGLLPKYRRNDTVLSFTINNDFKDEEKYIC